MWASAGPGPSSSSPKQWKSDGRVKIDNFVSARLPLTKSKKKKIIESTATLGTCFFCYGWDVYLLRLRTLAFSCQTLHCARKHQVHWALAVLCCRWAALPWLWPLPAAGFVPLEEAWDGVPLHKTSVRDKLQSSNSIRIYLVSIMHLVGLLKSSSRSQRFANSQMIRVWHNRHQHRPPQNYSQCCC